MENKQTFQFTLGPVQGFVAQARRTRDFWAGSFILSWLSSAAIACIQKQGGTIKFPVPDDNYLKHLLNEFPTDDNSAAYPQQGSIPNRFMATTAKVSDDFKPELVTETVRRAWRALADIVWENDLDPYAGQETRDIWERQITSFWEISWVLSDGTQTNLLDRRKNWRSLVLPSEPGHKCMMMDGWQELSGITQANMSQVNDFWRQLISSGNSAINNDLREKEQLCAMAFIKRRFSRYFDQVAVEMPENLGKLYGWPLPSAVPSVAFLAAAPWLKRVIDTAPPATFEEFHLEAIKITQHNEAAHVNDDSEFKIDIRCIREAAANRHADGFYRQWAGLDGQVYFPSALQNPRLFDDQQQAKRVLNKLNKLRESAGVCELPSPYYAILLMDGDQLGKHMSDEKKQTPISNALNQFTQSAGRIVRENNGFLIYAGGDDVLAVLPMDDALPAAAALQANYRKQFEQQSKKANLKIDSTLSGAIEFVHFRTPLTRVLQDAHNLLDEVAKNETGRNAVAVRVWKPSGMALQWAMPWEKALDENGKVKLVQLAEQFSQQTDQEEGERFSNKFFFRMKQLIERFPTASETTLQKLLLTEYCHSFGSHGKKFLEESLNALLDQCWQWQRVEVGTQATKNSAQPLNPDAALLVRFLAQKGLERDSL